MRPHITLLLIAALLSLWPGVASSDEPARPAAAEAPEHAWLGASYDPAANDDHAFLTYAVLHGLAADGVSAEQAAALAGEKFGPMFVPKCPICRPVEDAIRRYGERVKDAPQPPKGLDEARWAGLSSDDAATRHEALKAMIQRYTQDAYERLSLSPEQLEQLRNKLEEGKKNGMNGLSPDFGSDFCPSCDGATTVL